MKNEEVFKNIYLQKYKILHRLRHSSYATLPYKQAVKIHIPAVVVIVRESNGK